MKVLHVIDRLGVGGAEKVFLDITHLLAARNVAVDALLFDGSGELTDRLDKRVSLHVLNRVNKYSLAKLRQLHKLCSHYTIIHAHMRHVYQYVRLAQLLFRGKYQLLIHDHYGIDKNIPLSLKYVFKPRHYIGVCTSLVDWATSDVKVPSPNVYLLPNIIIPKSDGSYTSNKNTSRAIMVANVSRVKNIEFAIELVSRMDLQLDIYGNNRDESYYNELYQLIGSGAKTRVINDVSDFTHIYSRYDFAIHCSRSESGPLVLLEYLAAGIPFIAYKTGEVAEVIYSELPLLFVDSFDMDEWIRRIDVIKQMHDLPEKMRMVFSKHFSPEKYTEECLRIYERIGC
jgi:glycosyltransferase involved in cell wall biosynthesis